MKWPWSSRADADLARGGDRHAPSPAGWAFLPPLQRTIGDLQLATEPATFPHDLPAWRNPSCTGRMTHAVSADVPGGVIDGDGAGTGTPTTTSRHVEMPLWHPPPSITAVRQRQVLRGRSVNPGPYTAITIDALQRTPMPQVEYAVVQEAASDEPPAPVPDPIRPVTDEVSVGSDAGMPPAGTSNGPVTPAPFAVDDTTPGSVSTGYASDGATYLPISPAPIQRNPEPIAPVTGVDSPSNMDPATSARSASPTRGARLGLGAPLPAIRPTAPAAMPVAVQRAPETSPPPGGTVGDRAPTAATAADEHRPGTGEEPESTEDDGPAPVGIVSDPPTVDSPLADTAATAGLLGDPAQGGPPVVASGAPALTTQANELPTVTVSRTVAADATKADPTGASPAYLDDSPHARSSTLDTRGVADLQDADPTDHDLLGTLPPSRKPEPAMPAVSRASLDTIYSLPEPAISDVPKASLDPSQPLPGAAITGTDAPLLRPDLPTSEPTVPLGTPTAPGAIETAPAPVEPQPTLLAPARPAATVQRLATSALPTVASASRSAQPSTATLPGARREVGLLTHSPLAPTVRLPAVAPAPVGGALTSSVGDGAVEMPPLARGPYVETPVAPDPLPHGDVLQRSVAVSSSGLTLRLQRDAASDMALAATTAEASVTDAAESIPELTPAPAAEHPAAGADLTDGPGQATAAPATGGATGASGAGAAGATTPEQLDDLARRLMGPVTRRLKAEMILDRERRGLRADVR